MKATPEFRKKFLTNTDETGRFIVRSMRTGRTYYVEPIHTTKVAKGREWGSIDPATGKLMHKKGDGKYTGSVHASESLITKKNGVENITMLEPGMSPLAWIDWRDAQFPDAPK